MSGRLMYFPITDYQMNKRGRSLKYISTNALLVTLGKSCNKWAQDLDKELMFPKNNSDIEQAVLILLKEKHNRFTLCRVRVLTF